MNASVDPALLRMVQQHINKLMTDVDKLVFEVECDRETVKRALQDVAADVKELEKRVSVLEKENKGLKRSMKSFQDEQIGTKERIKSLESEQESVEQRLTQVEEQHKSSVPEISFGKFDNYYCHVPLFVFVFFFFAAKYYLNEYSYSVLFPIFMRINLI